MTVLASARAVESAANAIALTVNLGKAASAAVLFAVSRDRRSLAPAVPCVSGHECRGHGFFDSFHQYLALPPVFEGNLDLVAFFGAKYRFAKRRSCGEAAFLRIIGAFGNGTEIRFWSSAKTRTTLSPSPTREEIEPPAA
jgi:hypothetical protein